jgi:hypothetical protein
VAAEQADTVATAGRADSALVVVILALQAPVAVVEVVVIVKLKEASAAAAAELVYLDKVQMVQGASLHHIMVMAVVVAVLVHKAVDIIITRLDTVPEVYTVAVARALPMVVIKARAAKVQCVSSGAWVVHSQVH